MKFTLLLLFVYCFRPAFSQSPVKPAILKTEERAYTLVELNNGDLLPLIRERSGNRDTYYKDGRRWKVIQFSGVENDTISYSLLDYSGDTLVVENFFSKKGERTQTDSLLRGDDSLVKWKRQYVYKATGTTVTEENYTAVDSLHTRVEIKKDGVPEETILVKKLGPDHYRNTWYTPGGIATDSSITRDEWNKSKSVFISYFERAGRKSYNRFEFNLDQYGEWTGRLVFINKDSIGDHIDCSTRKILYAGQTAPDPGSKAFYYGYWVSLNGYRNYCFKQNGTVIFRRSISDDAFQDTLRWDFDVQRKQPYILLKEKQPRDLPPGMVQGNRLYMQYSPAKKSLTIGDFDCGQRPLLKRVRS